MTNLELVNKLIAGVRRHAQSTPPGMNMQDPEVESLKGQVLERMIEPPTSALEPPNPIDEGDPGPGG